MKTTLRFYLTPVRVAIIKNTNDNKYWEKDVGKGVAFHSTTENVN